MGFEAKRGKKRPKKGYDSLENAQRSSQYYIPGSVQGKVGWSFELSGLMEHVPAHGREVETSDL